MKHDIYIDPETVEIDKISGKESIINIFVKNLLTRIGSDFFDPKRGTSIYGAKSEGRVAVEVESAAKQTMDMIASNMRNRFGNFYLMKVSIVDTIISGDNLTLKLAFVFSDKTNILTMLEVSKI